MTKIQKIISTTLLTFSSFFLFAFIIPQNAKAIYQDGELGDILKGGPSQEQFLIGNKDQPGLITDNLFTAGQAAITGVQDSEGKQVKVGMLHYVNSTIAYMYDTPPISSREYANNILKNIGFPTTQKAHAESTGRAILNPTIDMWTIFRNLAYSIYIIIFVVIGFMIMFRTKINAQTVISIQSSLPKLIITLILITFSYAIAGFLVDIMYLSIYLVVYLFEPVLNTDQALQAINKKNALSAIFTGESGKGFLLKKTATAVGSLLMGLKEGKGIDKVLSTTFAGGLAGLIASATVAIQMIKLLFQLLKSYLLLIVQTITAPIQILPNAIPGQNSFISWLKKTASYLAPFPIVAAIFIFANLLIGPIKLEDGSTHNPFGAKKTLISKKSTTFLPFMLGKGTGAQDLGVILGILVIILAPSAIKMAQQFFQTEESPYASEIAAALGTGWQVGGWPIRTAWRAKKADTQARKQAQLLGSQIRGIGTETGAPPGSKEGD